MSTTTDPKQILKWTKPCPVDFSRGMDLRERICVANRGRRWAWQASREARFHARLERIRARSQAADNLARTLRFEDKPTVAGFWTALRDMYLKAHARALAAEY